MYYYKDQKVWFVASDRSYTSGKFKGQCSCGIESCNKVEIELNNKLRAKINLYKVFDNEHEAKVTALHNGCPVWFFKDQILYEGRKAGYFYTDFNDRYGALINVQDDQFQQYTINALECYSSFQEAREAYKVTETSDVTDTGELLLNKNINFKVSHDDFCGNQTPIAANGFKIDRFQDEFLIILN
jgi:acetone carboxylase gamma subunit